MGEGGAQQRSAEERVLVGVHVGESWMEHVASEHPWTLAFLRL